MIAGPLTLTESTLISLPGSWALPAYLLPRGVMSGQHSAALAGEQSVQTVLEGADGARDLCQQEAAQQRGSAGVWERETGGTVLAGVCVCQVCQWEILGLTFILTDRL